MSEHHQRSEGSRSLCQAPIRLTPRPARVSRTYLDALSISRELASDPRAVYTSPVPRHRRSRRASFRPSGRFVRACAFAAVAALALPAITPSRAVTPQPAFARLVAPSASPAEPAGDVAGVAQAPDIAAP